MSLPAKAERVSLPNGETITLRELFARYEEYIHRMDERDRRYAAERLADQRAVDSAFKASEKAIDKAEQAQTAYNARSNEFRQALDDQAKLQMSRTEIETRFNGIEEKIETNRQGIANLREANSGIMGKDMQASVATQQNQWVVATAIAATGVFVSLMAVGASIVVVLATK